MARAFVRASSHILYNTAAVVTAVPITMAAWFKSDDLTVAQCLIGVSYYAGGAGGDFFELVLRGNVAGDPVAAGCYQSGGTAQFAASSVGYSANVWQHGCAVFSANNARAAYLNGGNKGTNTGVQTPANISRTGVGELYRSDTPAQFMSGLIAEAGIWNVALGDDEVALLALGYSPLCVKPANLLAYWPLVGRYATEINLKSGYALTVSGATAADHCRIFSP